jgi:hypothetical protein
MDVDGTVHTGVIQQMCDIRKGPLKKMKDMIIGCYGCQTKQFNAVGRKCKRETLL